MLQNWLLALQQQPYLTGAFIGLLGLCLGSFFNVIIYRYPRILEAAWREDCATFLQLSPQPLSHQPPVKRGWKAQRSFCPQCYATLHWYELLPILSFCWQRGRCRHCQTKIHWQYPCVELLCAATMLAIWGQFGFTLQTLAGWLLTGWLIMLSLIDWHEQILPDTLTLSGVWMGLLLSLIPIFISPTAAIVGAALGYTVLWLISQLFEWIRHKPGMGHGDFKMFAMLGAWLGPISLLNIVITATFIGLFSHLLLLATHRLTRDQPAPFGPAIAIAGWLTLMFGPFLLNNWLL